MPEIDLGYVLGPKGDPGEPGRDGTDGTPGAPGTPGTDGKSAYQYAKEGGFVGTEEQFYTALAEVVLKMNKVIPRKVDTIATLSAAGQAQDSGKTLGDYFTREETYGKGDVYSKSETYSKTQADEKFATPNDFFSKEQTLKETTGQLFGSDVKTPDAAFQKIKQNFDNMIGAFVATGQYTGSGSTTKRIDLTGEPVLVIVYCEQYGLDVQTGNGWLESFLFCKGQKYAVASAYSKNHYIEFTEGTNYLQWQAATDDTATAACNATGRTYKWVALYR